MSVYEIANTSQNFREMARNKELSRPEKQELIQLHSTRGLALNVNANLNDVFCVLNKKYKL